jgi:hypothetical protein
LLDALLDAYFGTRARRVSAQGGALGQRGRQLGPHVLEFLGQAVARGDRAHEFHFGGEAGVGLGRRRRHIALELGAQVGQLGVLAVDRQLVLRLAHQRVHRDLARVAQLGVQPFDLLVALGRHGFGVGARRRGTVGLGTQAVALGLELGARVQHLFHVASGLGQCVAGAGAGLGRELLRPFPQLGDERGGHFRARRLGLRLGRTPGQQVASDGGRRTGAERGP